MRTDFVAVIVTNGRPSRVYTRRALRRYGYTGAIILVCDDEDPLLEEYQQTFGDEVQVFSKAEAAEYTDAADTTGDMRAVVYARNAIPGIVKGLGYRYFMVLDDDYVNFGMRLDEDLRYRYTGFRKHLDDAFEALVEFMEETPALTIAMSQGGDHIGGGTLKSYEQARLLRKAMNSFVCDVERPFVFTGRINEDVTTYVTEGRRGGLFFTVLQMALVQKQTQTNAGGLTETYLHWGTYVKSFYSVMYAPSCVHVGVLVDPSGFKEAPRLHHDVDWERAVPKILREAHRRED